jgi:hypothetical protein
MSDRGPGVDELEKSLIASAHLDMRPAPDAVKNRILAAVTAAGAVGASSATAGAIAATGAAGRLIIVKWVATTALVGAAGFGTYQAMRPTRAATPVSAHAPAHSEAPPAAPIEANRGELAPPSAPIAGERAEVKAPAPERRRAGAPRALVTAEPLEPPPATSLQAEVSLLDRARAAIASERPTGALEILDEYQQTFPRGNLRPEATYLRIQALHKSGQRAAARDLATRFLAEHPDTPHAAQVRPLTNP